MSRFKENTGLSRLQTFRKGTITASSVRVKQIACFPIGFLHCFTNLFICIGRTRDFHCNGSMIVVVQCQYTSKITGIAHIHRIGNGSDGRTGIILSGLQVLIEYVIAVVVLVNVIAFLLAYILTRGIKGQNFFRAGFFTPNLIGGIVLGYIWQFVFSRVFVSIGETTGWSLFEISWLSTPNKAFAALVLVSVWQLAGYMILIYVAGFMGLSEDVLEAASIDGASGWVKMKNIILPLMMSSVTICLFLTLSRAFMVYDVNLSLTGGAPYGTTEMAAMHVYEKAFTSRQFGVGQAEAFILFIIVACISGIQVYTTKKREVEA